MIIDITREFGDSKYEDYQDLLERHGTKYWYLGTNTYNIDPEDGDEYDDYYQYDKVEIDAMTTPEEDEFMDGLSKRYVKCIEHMTSENYYMTKRLCDHNIILWLERQNAIYHIVYDPLEYHFFDLAIKDYSMNKVFQAKWTYWVDGDFLVSIGWIKWKIEEAEMYINDAELYTWCKEELGDGYILGHDNCYFTQEAFILFKLRWL